MGVEIERKFLLSSFDEDRFLAALSAISHKRKEISQAYISFAPVLRLRKSDEHYILTYKGAGLLLREEHNIEMTQEDFERLMTKTEGRILEKTRYVLRLGNFTGIWDEQTLPLQEDLCLEVDIFKGEDKGLVLAEIEFADEEQALGFSPPTCLGREVTADSRYQNASLAKAYPLDEPEARFSSVIAGQ